MLKKFWVDFKEYLIDFMIVYRIKNIQLKFIKKLNSNNKSAFFHNKKSIKFEFILE